MLNRNVILGIESYYVREEIHNIYIYIYNIHICSSITNIIVMSEKQTQETKNNLIIIQYLHYLSVLFTVINFRRRNEILIIIKNKQLERLCDGFYLYTEYLPSESRQFKRRKSFDTARDIES